MHLFFPISHCSNISCSSPIQIRFRRSVLRKRKIILFHYVTYYSKTTYSHNLFSMQKELNNGSHIALCVARFVCCLYCHILDFSYGALYGLVASNNSFISSVEKLVSNYCNTSIQVFNIPISNYSIETLVSFLQCNSIVFVFI
jgi:hypothetical protein